MQHLKYWLTMGSKSLGHQEDEESIFEYINHKEYSVRIDNIKGRNRPTTSEINICTDRSKPKLGAGSGFVILGNKNLPWSATIFQAELIAIREACSHVLNNFPVPKYIKLFCNSQAALKVLSNNICKANTVKETHDILNELAIQHRVVRLQWIKAHIGLDGNELADEYAKLGTCDDRNQVYANRTQNQVKACTSNYIYHKWREKWRAIKKFRQTKLF